MIPVLYPYQADVVSEADTAFALGYRAVLIALPTGSGKTIVFSHLTMEEVKLGNRVWILAHRQELLSQASRTLVKFGVDHGVLRGGTKPDIGQQVLVASTQTVVRRLKDLPPPNLIILDESHHGTSKGCLKIFEQFPDARLLGVTATPCRLDGRGLGEVFDHLIVGPSNTFLVENGFLPHLKYYAPPVKADIASLKKLGGDYATRESEEAMDKPTVTGDAVSHYRSICDGASMIAFCVSVAHAQHVAEQYRAAGYSAASVDGNLSDDDRDDRITGLGSGKYQILTSCELIGEGLDVPSVEAVQLLRPTASLGLHLQQIGRIRVSKERPCGFVLDHVGNVGTTVNGRWVPKHGFASTEHRWTLDSKKKMTGDKGPATRTCGACYAVHLFRPACPYCGWEHPVKERTFTAMKVVDGTLVEVEQTKEEQREEVRNARSIPELMGIAKARGYKRPYFWALKTFQGRPIDTSLLT